MPVVSPGAGRKSATAMGRRGEEAAARYLQERGYVVLARNYRTRRAEIDLIATGEGYLVFVEVKARRTRRFGHGFEAVDLVKRRRLVLAAREYWMRHPDYRTYPVRFDVIHVQPVGDELWRVQWLPDAFSPMDLS